MLLFCKTILLILKKKTFYLFCKPHFTYSAIPSFLHILWKPPFKLLTTDATEIYLSCKYERHSHYAQYVNLRILPKLSAVHHNPKLAKTRRNQFQPLQVIPYRRDIEYLLTSYLRLQTYLAWWTHKSFYCFFLFIVVVLKEG